MTDKAFKRINGRGFPEWNWQKIKEALVIGVGVSLSTALIVATVTWVTNDRGEVKRDLKLLISGQKVQEYNAVKIAERVNHNTHIIYQLKDPKWPCPEDLVLESFWMKKDKTLK